jgi:hypothetical protein
MLTVCFQVIFEGETSWGYAEWDGPLLQISGNKITVEGASGAYLDGGGARWWDGLGGNGGVTKPKFFYAHSLTDSTITNLHIQNTPVQVSTQEPFASFSLALLPWKKEVTKITLNSGKRVYLFHPVKH